MTKKNIVGQNIQYYRKKLNLTQFELAEKIGVSWEMISRYERGKSSAMRQIRELTKALRINYNQILADRDSNQIDSLPKLQDNFPLFVELPTKLEFKQENTDVYYSVPQWIVHKDRNGFAIHSSLINIETIQLQNSSILYISPSIAPKKNDIVLVRDSKKRSQVKAIRYNSNVTIINLIGIVLCQEIRFRR